MIVSTIYLVAILLLALLFFKITHIIWKTIIFTILIIILVFGITGYAIYEDIQKTINEDKIFIISGDDMVLTGIIFSDNIEERVYLNQWEIEEYSNFYAFYDLGFYTQKTTTEDFSDQPFGFGLGMRFGTKGGVFDISYALGKQFDNPILFKNAKIHFGYRLIF